MENMNKAQLECIEDATKTSSIPSQLKITDVRTAIVCSNYDYPLVRIETNQGVYGIGQAREGGHRENILQFKGMLLGKNPCHIDLIYNTIKHFGNWSREGAGISAIEIALWDLIGKVYGVPCWQFLGGKYRDKIRIYADTAEPLDTTPEAFVERVLQRVRLGFDFVKFDVGPATVAGTPGALLGPRGTYRGGLSETDGFGYRRIAPGSGAGAWVSDKGIGLMRDIVAAVREAVGSEVSLCLDHFGHGFMTAKEVIRFAELVEPYGLAWMEDPMPWYDIDGHKYITDTIRTPTASGEELYSWDSFRGLIEKRAVDIIHPDITNAGGMLETKKIADYAERHGMPTALHNAGSPVAFVANLHVAASIQSFIALEHHGLDVPFWADLVTGLPEVLVDNGYAMVPDKPGLGIDLNYEAIREHLRAPSGLFEPTEEWNTPKVGFYQPDTRWEGSAIGRKV